MILCNFCLSEMTSRCNCCNRRYKSTKCSMEYFHDNHIWVEMAHIDFKKETEGQKYKIVNRYSIPSWLRDIKVRFPYGQRFSGDNPNQ